LYFFDSKGYEISRNNIKKSDSINDLKQILGEYSEKYHKPGHITASGSPNITKILNNETINLIPITYYKNIGDKPIIGYVDKQGIEINSKITNALVVTDILNSYEVKSGKLKYKKRIDEGHIILPNNALSLYLMDLMMDEGDLSDTMSGTVNGKIDSIYVIKKDSLRTSHKNPQLYKYKTIAIDTVNGIKEKRELYFHEVVDKFDPKEEYCYIVKIVKFDDGSILNILFSQHKRQ
jgi:hypothetical protein